MKRKDQPPVSLRAVREWIHSDTACLDNGGIPGAPTGAMHVGRPTPQSIHPLRCYLLFSNRRLSGARFDDYSSGSQSFVFQLMPTIADSL